MFLLVRQHAPDSFNGAPKFVYEFGPDKAPLLEFFNELIQHDDCWFAELSHINEVELDKERGLNRVKLCRSLVRRYEKYGEV